MRERREDYDDYDDEDDRPDEPVEYPALVGMAGIIWVVFGCLILLNAAAFLVLSFAAAGEEKSGTGATAEMTGALCAYAFLVLFGGAFLFVGVQNIRGTATDTLGNAIGSMVFGVLNLGYGGLVLAGTAAVRGPAVAAVIGGVISLLAGIGLVAAGVLALVGREDYKAWRREQKGRRRRRRD